MTGPDRGEIATDCDKCAAPIPYGVTCYAVPTGRVWDGDDEDAGKPIVEIVCFDCYVASGKDPLSVGAHLEAVRR